MDEPLTFAYSQGAAHDLARQARVCGPEWCGAGATEGNPLELNDSPVAAPPSAQRRATADISHLKTPGAFVTGEVVTLTDHGELRGKMATLVGYSDQYKKWKLYIHDEVRMRRAYHLEKMPALSNELVDGESNASPERAAVAAVAEIRTPETAVPSRVASSVVPTIVVDPAGVNLFDGVNLDDDFVGAQLDDRVLLNSKELDVAGITDGIKTKIVTLIAQRNEFEKALAMERACHRRTLLEGDNAREALELALGTQGNLYEQNRELGVEMERAIDETMFVRDLAKVDKNVFASELDAGDMRLQEKHDMVCGLIKKIGKQGNDWGAQQRHMRILEQQIVELQRTRSEWTTKYRDAMAGKALADDAAAKLKLEASYFKFLAFGGPRNATQPIVLSFKGRENTDIGRKLKALGARFVPSLGSWFVDPPNATQPFAEWLLAPQPPPM